MQIINIFLIGVLLFLLGIIAGASAVDVKWKNALVKEKHAQYNISTGTWCLRSIDDIATDGIILGKARPEQKISE